MSKIIRVELLTRKLLAMSLPNCRQAGECQKAGLCVGWLGVRQDIHVSRLQKNIVFHASNEAVQTFGQGGSACLVPMLGADRDLSSEGFRDQTLLALDPEN